MPDMNNPGEIEAKLARVFKRDDLRGVWPLEMNDDIAAIAGLALARMTAQRQGSARIALGYDARTGSPALARAFANGARAGGAAIVFLGLCSTEQVYFQCGVNSADIDSGAMITASHNPKEYNGLKVLWKGAAPFSQDDMLQLRKIMQNSFDELPDIQARSFPLLKVKDCRQDFTEHLLKLVDFDNWPSANSPMKIVVDGGNGVGGHCFASFADALATKNCHVIFKAEDPNGDFPLGVPNPLLPECQARLAAEILEEQADMGILFDGDADRAGIATETGKILTGSQTLALLAQRKLAKRMPSERPAILMKNLCCSQLLDDLFAGNDAIKVMQTPVGHGRIKLLMRHPSLAPDVLMAGEHSGHYFYPEFNSVDSGIISALNLIGATIEYRNANRSLERTVSAWREKYVDSGEINRKLESRDKINAILKLLWEYFKHLGCKRYEVAPDATLGLLSVHETEGEYLPENLSAPDLKIMSTVPDGAGWCVVRPSGNEPALRFFIETWGNNAKIRLERLQQEIAAIIEKNA